MILLTGALLLFREQQDKGEIPDTKLAAQHPSVDGLGCRNNSLQRENVQNTYIHQAIWSISAIYVPVMRIILDLISVSLVTSAKLCAAQG